MAVKDVKTAECFARNAPQDLRSYHNSEKSGLTVAAAIGC